MNLKIRFTDHTRENIEMDLPPTEVYQIEVWGALCGKVKQITSRNAVGQAENLGLVLGKCPRCGTVSEIVQLLPEDTGRAYSGFCPGCRDGFETSNPIDPYSSPK